MVPGRRWRVIVQLLVAAGLPIVLVLGQLRTDHGYVQVLGLGRAAPALKPGLLFHGQCCCCERGLWRNRLPLRAQLL